MSDDPFNIPMPVADKPSFAKTDMMVDQQIAHFQCIQWNKIQDSQPGYKTINLLKKNMLDLI